VPRARKSDIDVLLEEARAIELLASETIPIPERTQEYWQASSDLLALVLDIEQYQSQHPDAAYDDPELFLLKQRLRSVASRLTDLGTD
jgi:hypothetical protein